MAEGRGVPWLMRRMAWEDREVRGLSFSAYGFPGTDSQGRFLIGGTSNKSMG